MSTTIHHIKRGHANCYILEGDGLILVDAGMKWTKKDLEKEFRSRDLKLDALRLIVITHGHIDHFGGLQTFQERGGHPPVLCHKLAETALKSGKSVAVTPRNFLGKLIVPFILFTSQTPIRIQDPILIEAETDLSPYGVKATVIPTPGHTSCSLSIILPDGTALLGDTVMPGKKKKPGIPFFLENREQLRASYKQLVHLITGTCYTGHGGPYSADDVIAMMHHESFSH